MRIEWGCVCVLLAFVFCGLPAAEAIPTQPVLTRERASEFEAKRSTWCVCFAQIRKRGCSGATEKKFSSLFLWKKL